MSVESLLLLVIVLCGAGVLYAYIAFPALAAVMTQATHPQAIRTRTTRADRADDDMPPVTVIIPAYNEERTLDAKIRNVLASDYPSDRLEALVVSDASTDHTNDIARSFED